MKSDPSSDKIVSERYKLHVSVLGVIPRPVSGVASLSVKRSYISINVRRPFDESDECGVLANEIVME